MLRALGSAPFSSVLMHPAGASFLGFSMASSAETTPADSIRILHTSDWHLGKTLSGVDRTKDFAALLDWVLATIDAEKPDVVLISGDIFDTTMPSTTAQQLYYDFLAEASRRPIWATVVAAGNHDSPRFLSAPGRLLKTAKCVVSGEDVESQALVIRDSSGKPRLGLAAVPYLREGDVRTSSADMSDEDRALLWEKGVRERYAAVHARLLDKLCGEMGEDAAAVPLVAMGHLFVTGSRVSPESRLNAANSHFVGTLRNVSADAFGGFWAYVALGHIHSPQQIKSAVPTYYSGAPLALSFKNEKDSFQVLLADVAATKTDVTVVPVPQPRFIGRIRGDRESLLRQIDESAQLHPGAILEAIFEGEATDPGELVKALRIAAEDAGVNLGPVRVERACSRNDDAESFAKLEDVTPEEVFESVMSAEGLSDETKTEMRRLFREACEAAQTAAAVDAEKTAAGARAPSGRRAEGQGRRNERQGCEDHATSEAAL